MSSINALLVPFVGSIVILIDYYNRRSADVVQKKLLTLLIFFVLTTKVSDVIFSIVNGVPVEALRYINWAACTLYFLLISVAFGFIILLFEHSLNGNSVSLKRMATAIIILNAIYAALLIVNLFNYMFFYINHDNFYVVGDLYMVVFAVPILLVVLMLLNLLLNRKNVNKRMFVLALISSMPLTLASALDILITDSFLVWQGFFVSVLFFYLFIIHKAALVDNLTNVNNRRGFDEYIQSITKSANRKAYAFVMIDMDKFKDINDQFGHVQGDNALRDAAEILRSSVRRRDFVARYGGDEFVVIASTDNVDIIIKNIQAKFDDFNAKKIRPYQLYLSCGGDVYKPDDVRPISDFLTHVDALMYLEKERRRGI